MRLKSFTASDAFFLKLDAMHAFWAIPLCEESKKLMAFQTHEGVFAWSRFTMGCRPASQIQQTAFHNAMDKHMPATASPCSLMTWQQEQTRWKNFSKYTRR
jgi:hypothetical protein